MNIFYVHSLKKQILELANKIQYGELFEKNYFFEVYELIFKCHDFFQIHDFFNSQFFKFMNLLRFLILVKTINTKKEAAEI